MEQIPTFNDIMERLEGLCCMQAQELDRQANEQRELMNEGGEDGQTS